MLKMNGGATAVARFNMPGNVATKRLAISGPLRFLRVNANTRTRAARNIVFSWGLRRIALSFGSATQPQRPASANQSTSGVS